MAYSYDFKDNVVYGADHINAIRASFLTKGVVEESSTSCMAVMDGAEVKILAGQAIFEDGCCIKIDEDGVKVTPVSGVKNYIYFHNNTLAGVCEVLADTKMPRDDFVMIAELDEYGNITDARTFVQLKTTDNERYAASFSEEFTMRDNMSTGEIVKEIQLPKSNLSYMEFEMRIGSETVFVRFFPKENGRVIWKYKGGDFYMANELSIVYSGRTINLSLEVSEDKLVVRWISISTVTGNHMNIKMCGVCMR